MQKRYKMRNFRPTPKNEERMALAASLGLNVSAMINEALDERFEVILRQKSKERHEAFERVVRGGGFEPPTPTVSR